MVLWQELFHVMLHGLPWTVGTHREEGGLYGACEQVHPCSKALLCRLEAHQLC